LARDLSHLMRLGFTPQSVTPWDMIPLSDAVETLVILASGEPFRPRVLYADAELLAVDKPAFFPTTPQGEQATSLLEAVRRLPDAGDSVPVHRLDLGTSGVCLFARTPDKVEVLSRALAEGHKEYLALVQGIARKKGRIERKIPDGAKLRPAVTRYERDRVVGTHSLVRALPEQGRRHQIRRHLAHIGHPVLGDARYGNPSANRLFEERHGLDRTFLHLERLRLVLNGQTLEIHAELAPELEATLRSLARAHAARRVSSESSVEAEKATPGRE
jgi:23S rRNA (uracil1939-C5)-methyltransferase